MVACWQAQISQRPVVDDVLACLKQANRHYQPSSKNVLEALKLSEAHFDAELGIVDSRTLHSYQQ